MSFKGRGERSKVDKTYQRKLFGLHKFKQNIVGKNQMWEVCKQYFTLGHVATYKEFNVGQSNNFVENFYFCMQLICWLWWYKSSVPAVRLRQKIKRSAKPVGYTEMLCFNNREVRINPVPRDLACLPRSFQTSTPSHYLGFPHRPSPMLSNLLYPSLPQGQRFPSLPETKQTGRSPGRLLAHQTLLLFQYPVYLITCVLLVVLPQLPSKV